MGTRSDLPRHYAVRFLMSLVLLLGVTASARAAGDAPREGPTCCSCFPTCSGRTRWAATATPTPGRRTWTPWPRRRPLRRRHLEHARLLPVSGLPDVGPVRPPQRRDEQRRPLSAHREVRRRDLSRRRLRDRLLGQVAHHHAAEMRARSFATDSRSPARRSASIEPTGIRPT